MSMWTMIIFMAVIGAAIGAITNALAIMMLFRPYRPLYIGSWKLPFTPGLIPKRRAELAEQIGKIVSEYLLTPESVGKKLNAPDFQAEMTGFLQEQAKPLFKTEKSVGELLDVIQFNDSEQKTKQWVENWMDRKYNEIKGFYVDKSVRESLPIEWLEKVEVKIPEVSNYMLTKGIDYFSSIEGKRRVKRMTDDFLEGWGKFGSMVQMVLGNTSLEDKIQPEIIKFLKNPGTKELIDSILISEWEKVQDWKWEYILSQLSDDKALAKGKAFVVNQLDLPGLFHRKAADLFLPFEQKLLKEIIPVFVDKGSSYLAVQIPVIMEKLRIGDMVREQVEAFSVERLEQIVLEISKRELKMITFLGAVLGGLIGVVQGLIVSFFP